MDDSGMGRAMQISGDGDAGDAPFTSVIGFRVHPGREADFVRAFHACGMLERPRMVDGFVSATLSQEHDDATSFMVIGRWRTADAYAQWTGSSRVGADEDALRALGECLLELIPGRLFRKVS